MKDKSHFAASLSFLFVGVTFSYTVFGDGLGDLCNLSEPNFNVPYGVHAIDEDLLKVSVALWCLVR